MMKIMTEFEEISNILKFLEEKLEVNFQLKILDNDKEMDAQIRIPKTIGCKSLIHNTDVLLEQYFYKRTF